MRVQVENINSYIFSNQFHYNLREHLNNRKKTTLCMKQKSIKHFLKFYESMSFINNREKGFKLNERTSKNNYKSFQKFLELRKKNFRSEKNQNYLTIKRFFNQKFIIILGNNLEQN